MNLQQIKPGRNADFQQAVLEGARHEADNIVQAAERKRELALRDAYLHCKEANYALIKAKHEKDTRRRASAAAQQARAELLRFRQELVENLFAQVEEKLVQFAASTAYTAFVQNSLAKHKKELRPGLLPIVYVRPADMGLAPALQEALPGCEVRKAGDIRLGGVKLACGNLLFDETLDEALQAEKADFVAHSGLRV